MRFAIYSHFTRRELVILWETNKHPNDSIDEEKVVKYISESKNITISKSIVAIEDTSDSLPPAKVWIADVCELVSALLRTTFPDDEFTLRVHHFTGYYGVLDRKSTRDRWLKKEQEWIEKEKKAFFI